MGLGNGVQVACFLILSKALLKEPFPCLQNLCTQNIFSAWEALEKFVVS